jgi:hypothetical protein
VLVLKRFLGPHRAADLTMTFIKDRKDLSHGPEAQRCKRATYYEITVDHSSDNAGEV